MAFQVYQGYYAESLITEVYKTNDEITTNDCDPHLNPYMAPAQVKDYASVFSLAVV